jgi:hypothetical protein
MCLKTNRKVAQKYLKKWNGKKTVTVYKAFEIREFEWRKYRKNHWSTEILETKLVPALVTDCVGFEYKVGETIAKTYVRAKLGTCRDNVDVNHGLHVFLDKREAEKYATRGGLIVVPLTAEIKDCTAIGKYGDDDSAVFKKLTLSQKEYDRAIAQK